MRAEAKPNPLTPQARKLRKDETPAERLLWKRLRNHHLDGHRFRRQDPIGPFIGDFVCEARKLIVELDGGHHARKEDADADRTAWLGTRGYKVLRFWNNEVIDNMDGVLNAILAALSLTLPPASPAGPSFSRHAGEGL